MGFLARIFGDVGTIRFEADCLDGRTVVGKTKIESFNLSREELEKELINKIYVEEGVRVQEVRIIGFSKEN